MERMYKYSRHVDLDDWGGKARGVDAISPRGHNGTRFFTGENTRCRAKYHEIRFIKTMGNETYLISVGINMA
jgi:hypothetical protein